MINIQLKQAIIESGISHRQLSIATGVDRRTIGRFMSSETDADIRISNAAVLAAFFGLELRPVKKSKPKRTRHNEK